MWGREWIEHVRVSHFEQEFWWPGKCNVFSLADALECDSQAFAARTALQNELPATSLSFKLHH